MTVINTQTSRLGDDSAESIKNDLSYKWLRGDIGPSKQDGDTVCRSCNRIYHGGQFVQPDGNYMEDSTGTVNVNGPMLAAKNMNVAIVIETTTLLALGSRLIATLWRRA